MQIYLKFLLLAALLFPLLGVSQEEESQLPMTTPVDRTEPLPPALARVHPLWRDFVPEWREEPCPFGPRGKYDTERIECGFVLVPENRREPNSRLIRLSVARMNADVDDPPAGSTVYLSGGPGYALTPLVPAFASSSSERARTMRASSHWIFPDQRGVGFSQPYFCRGLYSEGTDDAPLTKESLERWNQELDRCLADATSSGVDIQAYSTWDNAMDIRDIRRALQLEQWNLFGISYGTELGQMVLRIDAPGIHAAVLDSVVVPGLGWEGYSYGISSALSALNRACIEHGDCAERYGDLDQLARRVVDEFREKPLELDGLDPLISLSGKLVFNHHATAGGLFLALYSRELYPALPAMMEALLSRDEELIRAYVEQLSMKAGPDVGFGLQILVSCTGTIVMAPETLAAARKDRPFWSEALVDGRTSESCRSLGLTATDPLTTPLQTDIPVLVAAGTVDPITPPSYSGTIMSGLENGFYIEVPHTGHGATHSGCGASVISSFFQEPGVEPDTSCLEEMPPPAFVTNYKSTRAALRLGKHVENGDYMSAAWGALPVLFLLSGVLAFPLTAIGRRIDGIVDTARLPRMFAWLTALLAIAAVGMLALAIQQTLAVSSALLPLGLIGPTSWVTAALVLALITAAGSVWTLRGSKRPVGTTIGVLLTVCSLLMLLVFLMQLDLLF